MSILKRQNEGGVLVLGVDHDPRAVATDAPRGSEIIDANGDRFFKLDDGSTTNVSTAKPVRVDIVAHGFLKGEALFQSGANAYTKTRGNNSTNSQFTGFVVEVISVDAFLLQTDGVAYNLFAATLTEGSNYYASEAVAGALVEDPTAFAAGSVTRKLCEAVDDSSVLIVHQPGVKIVEDTPEETVKGKKKGSGAGKPTNLTPDDLREMIDQAGWLPFTWAFDVATADADPGGGVFRLNNATQGSATQIFADVLADGGHGMTEILNQITSPARIILVQTDDATRYHVCNVTGAAVDGTGYFKIPISVQDSGAALEDTKNVNVLIVPLGVPVHAASHTDGSDDIQNATAAQKGLATAAQITKLDGIETGATADQSDAEIETAYNTQVDVVLQAEAEAGTSTTVRRWTAERVKQAIAALAGSSPLAAIADGSNSITADVETTVATFTVADGNVPVAHINLTDNVVFGIHAGDTGTAPASDVAHFMFSKTTTDNQYQLRIRHKDGGSLARNFKWIIKEMSP
jgi:hypothetical protein